MRTQTVFKKASEHKKKLAAARKKKKYFMKEKRSTRQLPDKFYAFRAPFQFYAHSEQVTAALKLLGLRPAAVRYTHATWATWRQSCNPMKLGRSRTPAPDIAQFQIRALPHSLSAVAITPTVYPGNNGAEINDKKKIEYNSYTTLRQWRYSEVRSANNDIGWYVIVFSLRATTVDVPWLSARARRPLADDNRWWQDASFQHQPQYFSILSAVIPTQKSRGLRGTIHASQPNKDTPTR